MTGAPKRTAQISPDRFGVGMATIALVMVIMIASFIFSYVAIAEAGQWTHVPYGMHWLAPVFIDGAILTYTVSLAVLASRAAPRRKIRQTRAILWSFTGLSVAINFAHAASGWGWDFGVLEAWFGCMIAVSAPVAALVSAEEVVHLAFKRHANAAPVDDPVITGAPQAEAQTVESAAFDSPGSFAAVPVRPGQAPSFGPMPDSEPYAPAVVAAAYDEEGPAGGYAFDGVPRY